MSAAEVPAAGSDLVSLALHLHRQIVPAGPSYARGRKPQYVAGPKGLDGPLEGVRQRTADVLRVQPAAGGFSGLADVADAGVTRVREPSPEIQRGAAHGISPLDDVQDCVAAAREVPDVRSVEQTHIVNAVADGHDQMRAPRRGGLQQRRDQTMEERGRPRSLDRDL